ncbi:hypothetical protein SH661x_000503 [Planctomicrobium sp. SH661]|uniref:hypothetical protein n=1 Tax=Planctomicrobium sp. SH661 TaxID=3448124 RepID=UPI003F5B95D7
MIWLEPWWSTEDQSAAFHETFLRQLKLEVPPGHPLFGAPVRLIARGNGDDALFEFLDGSGRVAIVHLTWATRQERLPWPVTTVYPHLQTWGEEVMIPQHREWTGNAGT